MATRSNRAGGGTTKADGASGRSAGAKEPGLPELHTQMRIANRLAAARLKASMGQQELVRLLAGTGATNAEIADVLDTTPATVNVTLQRLRRRASQQQVSNAIDIDAAEPQSGGVA